MQLVLKKIACKVALKATKKFNTAYFSTGLQHCLEDFGTEKVSLFFRAAQQTLPSNDFWSLDGDNGFGRISRVVGLFETKKHFPYLLPLLKMIYGTSSNAWYFGLKTGIESIESEEGIQQGDVLSMWFYAMAIHPLLQRLRDILGSDGFTKWYADDGYVNAPFEKMIEVIDAVKTLGPAVGYYVKISKGTYLLGKCSDLETANYRKNQLIGLGLDENTIIIHPENDPSTQNIYGCKILGSFIGTDEYIRTQLDIKYEKLAIQAQSLKEFPNKQGQHLILLYCLSAKVNHIQRLHPPELVTEFISKFDLLKRSVFSNIIGQEVNDFTWSHACLSLSDGGLGYQDVKNVTYPAYISAFYNSTNVLNVLTPETDYDITECNIPMVRSFHEALEEHARICGTPKLTCDQLDYMNMEGIRDFAEHTFQQQLTKLQSKPLYNNLIAQVTDTKLLGWLTSLKNESSKSAKWLEMVPNKPALKFSSQQFQISLCYRLYLTLPCYVLSTRCYCNNRPLLDSRGHHIANGCQKNGALLNTHDSTKFMLEKLCNFAGLYTRVEETGVFQEAMPNSNRRPDLSIYNHPSPNYYPHKLIVDVSFAHPIPITAKRQLTRNQALIPARAANAAFNRKINSYSVISEQAGLKFKPLIFETTGRLHEDTEAFIKELLDIACQRLPKAAHSAIRHFWFGMISATIQKSLANTILDKSRVINGRLTHQSNLRASEEFLANLPSFLANSTL